MNSQIFMKKIFMLKHVKWTTTIVTVLLGTGLASANTVQADTASDAQVNNQVVQNSNQSQSSTTTEKKAPAFNRSDYLSSNPKIIRLKQNATIYKDAALTQIDHQAKKGYHYLTSKLVTPADSAPVLKLSNSKYISAKKLLIAKVKGYQNPKKYHQVQKLGKRWAFLKSLGTESTATLLH